MAKFGKKEKKTAAPKASGKVVSSRQPKQPKPPKTVIPPDIYTLLLGLSTLFLIVAMVVLGLNYNDYRTVDPNVVPWIFEQR